jgi:uncharacterized protein (DUF305 family)
MSGWLTSWGQPVPTPTAGHDMSQMGDMDGMMSEAEMQQLQAASGAAFDRMWLQMMTKHHQGAVTMATTETQQGQNSDAKALAQQIITAQNKEIAAGPSCCPPSPAEQATPRDAAGHRTGGRLRARFRVPDARREPT